MQVKKRVLFDILCVLKNSIHLNTDNMNPYIIDELKKLNIIDYNKSTAKTNEMMINNIKVLSRIRYDKECNRIIKLLREDILKTDFI